MKTPLRPHPPLWRTVAPARGATSWRGQTLMVQRRFDPRSLTGSDGVPFKAIAIFCQFRSALPHGERRDSDRAAGVVVKFRSALPHGERPPSGSTRRASAMFRSALPHGERPAGGVDQPAAWPVSIRAPARGATSCFRMRSRARSFDPRSRTGSDPGAAPGLCAGARFRSALPHGERRPPFASHRPSAFAPKFRSALPHGERRGARTAASTIVDPERFRSALPHGERLGLHQAARAHRLACFDPRSRTGSDNCRVRDVPARPMGCFDPRSRTGSD